VTYIKVKTGYRNRLTSPAISYSKIDFGDFQSMFNIENYDYSLPDELIAQVPLPDRDQSRLMVADRSTGSLTDRHFFDLPELLSPGDLLVLNNTRVVPARLFGRKESGGRIEILVLEHSAGGTKKPDARWCLLRSSKRPRKGSRLLFEKDLSGVVESLGEDGLIQIAFQGPRSIDSLLEEKGRMPLPPYIRRKENDRLSKLDRERYQTVFAEKRGAVAAPTASLHFTRELLARLQHTGVSVVYLTLHVGHGTFRPVRTRDIREHRLGHEEYEIDEGTASAIERSKSEGRRVIAVGTTVVRTLESAVGQRGEIRRGRGKTELLITPGFPFRVVDALITNFHLPRSSLLFLVSAFAGLDLVRHAYQEAVAKTYRFFSYGDAMLIL
jgi:S-adenosylmethionine:tRNA ribosyltransferase-isomerase